MNKKNFKTILIILICLALVFISVAFVISNYIKSITKNSIITIQDAAKLEDIDCIIVLGCLVRNDGTLSDMLRDRLIRAIELYEAGAAPKILMSGDHGTTNYDEVNAMKQYAIENGIPSEDVFMDHAGFSTYETIYRAKEVFGAKKVIIVTQEYHLSRALYIARQFDIEAYGVSADLNTYGGQTKRDIREVLARCKDFCMCIFKPEPKYLGEAIPINGNGNVTNDKYQ